MPEPEPIYAASYGGGVQSTAMLVLAAQGYLPHRIFLFANVGDDSEHPATLSYVREVAFDYAAANGIQIEELTRVPRKGRSKGQETTLYRTLVDPGTMSLPIPLRSPASGRPGSRSCTADYKVRVVQRWLQEHGASASNPAHVAIGISTDEYERATSTASDPCEILEYPLLTLEHRLAPNGASRADCEAIIRDAGLPVPHKSSCYFCPFHKPTVWADMARDEPVLFRRAADLEAKIIERRATQPCLGAGHWPQEATVGADALTPTDDETELFAEEEGGRSYREGWEPSDGAGSCRSCWVRTRVERDAEGRWVVAAHNRGPLYLTRFGKPLRQVFGEESPAGIQGALDLADDGYRCGDRCAT